MRPKNLPRVVVACFGVFALFGAAGGCSVEAARSDDHRAVQATASDIIGGSVASDYEEAALVDLYSGGFRVASCSGAVIAPMVVLTAGHCVAGFDSWNVIAPYSSGQTSTASGGATYDWTGGSSTVDPTQHDIGLIFLDNPINLTRFPALATSKLASGSNIVNIGRIDNGSLSRTDLFVSEPLTARDGAAIGYPFDYYASVRIQRGDSGGPTEVPGTSPHLIVAVNSGAGRSTEVLARTDLINGWIQDQITANPPDPGP